MGWSVKKLCSDECIHSLVYRIMEVADTQRGESAAHYTGKFLYRSCDKYAGFSAWEENASEPCGIIIFSPDELKFLYVAEGSFRDEIAHSLVEHALGAQKESSDCIYSLFPSWKETLGQDLLSPRLPALGFRELHLTRGRVSLDAPGLEHYFTNDYVKPLKATGYSFTGWKRKEHLSRVTELILGNPSPFIQALFDAHMPKGREWLERQLFTGELGQEYYYPSECSVIVLSGSETVGALLCEERGWINQIVVHQSHAGKGIAKAMMQKAYKALKVIEAKEMALSVYRENENAFSWYSRMGFATTLEHSVWVWRKEP